MSKRNFSLVVLLVSSLAALTASIILVVDSFNTNPAYSNSVVDTETTTGSSIQNPIVQNPNNNVDVPVINNGDPNNNSQVENPTGSSQNGTENPNGSDVPGDVANMSEAEILAMLGDAVNKTKAYTSTLSVKHVETFDANVTECTGGSTVASIANSVVSSIAAPTDEVLTFNGGTATDSEGETVTILLPQKGNFRLTMDGIKTITATKNGDEIVVKVTLVEETVDHTVFPTFNAAGVGYLDLSTLDLGVLSIDTANMIYPGSTIEAHIRPDGYVGYAAYTIPMDVSVSTKGLIKANLAFEGMQTETWQFNW